MRISSLLLVAASASLLVVVPTRADAQSIHNETTRTDLTAPITRVVVRDAGGRVVVRRGTAPAVVSVEHWNTRRPTVTTSLRKGVLRVTATCPRTAGAGDVTVAGPNGCSVDLTVTVPETASLDVVDSIGNLTVRGMRGRMRLASDTGTVRAVAIDPTRLRAVSGVGDVVVTVPRGPYDYRATSGTGTVHVAGITQDPTATRLFLHTDTGDVRLTGS